MAYSSDPNSYKREDLKRLAELMFDRDRTWTDDQISDELNERPRAKVLAMRKAVMKSDIVHIVIEPSHKPENSASLRSLASRIREQFNLRDCQIVPGRIEMLKRPLEDNIRELIVDEITREAAYQLQFRFEQADNPCLAVVYGFVTRKIANYLGTNAEVKITEKGFVVAAHGERQLEMDRFDANSIVHDIGRRFGCKYACLPLPFLAPKDLQESIRRMPLVDLVLHKLKEDINMALIGLASHHQQRWDKTEGGRRQQSLQNELTIEESDREAIKEALGTIGGLWFDHKGQDVPYQESFVPGLSLNDLRRIVAEHPVILACGGDCSRLPALAVALKHNLCSVWIGDEASAMALLGVQEVARPDINWSMEEMKILEQLKMKRFV